MSDGLHQRRVEEMQRLMLISGPVPVHTYYEVKCCAGLRHLQKGQPECRPSCSKVLVAKWCVKAPEYLFSTPGRIGGTLSDHGVM